MTSLQMGMLVFSHAATLWYDTALHHNPQRTTFFVESCQRQVAPSARIAKQDSSSAAELHNHQNAHHHVPARRFWHHIAVAHCGKRPRTTKPQLDAFEQVRNYCQRQAQHPSPRQQPPKHYPKGKKAFEKDCHMANASGVFSAGCKQVAPW